MWSKGNIRVHPITTIEGIQEHPFKIITRQRDVLEGLGIEYKIDDSYIVIAFVKPDKDGICSYESIGTRIEDYCETWEDILVFREALNFAIKTIKDSWREQHEQ